MRVQEIPVKRIRVEENTSRKNRAKDNVADLMHSIKEQGVINPITVRKNGSGFVIVSGHRRYAAIRKLGLKTVPAVVRSMGDTDSKLQNIAENVIRSNPTLQEEGHAYQELLKEGMTHGEIASRIGVTLSRVQQALKLWETVPRKWISKIAANPSPADRKKGKISYTLAHHIVSNRLKTSEVDYLFEMYRNGSTEAEVKTTMRQIKKGSSPVYAARKSKDIQRVVMSVFLKKKPVAAFEKRHKKRVPTIFKRELKKKFPELFV